MSGAAGLAAAKRRRSAAPVTKTKPARTSLQSAPSSTPPPAPMPTSENKISPLQALNQHETRIKELEDETRKVEGLNKEINELKQAILKIQTFAIEQSLELTKLRKSMETKPIVVESPKTD